MKIPQHAFVISALVLSAVVSFAQDGPPRPGNLFPLNSWSLSAPPWDSDFGDPARGYAGLSVQPGWDDAGTCLSVDTNECAYLNFNVYEQPDWTNISVDSANGSLSFWYEPNFTSIADGGSGCGSNWATLLNIGAFTANASVGDWLLAIDPPGSNILFLTAANGSRQVVFKFPIDMDAGDWWNIDLTWSDTNTCLYLNGQLATNCGPVLYRPSSSECLEYGFFVGSMGTNGQGQAMGQFQELVSYDYPLAAQDVALYHARGSAAILNWGGTVPGGGFHADGSGPPTPGGGPFDTNPPPPVFNYTIPTNGLWLSVTGLSNGIVFLDLNNATDYVYEIFSATNLGDTWNAETEVFPTNRTAMPFTVNQAGRSNLFLCARDWTGITSGNNTTPDWWMYYWFGELGLSMSDTNVDPQWVMLSTDYQKGQDPDVISFSLTATNQYVNTSSVPMQSLLTAGIPFYMAALVDDTNWADAHWIPYNSNVTISISTYQSLMQTFTQIGASCNTNDFNVFIGTNQGWHHIWVGLRGMPASSQQTWDSYRVKLDTTPPLLAITNPASFNVMQPMIQVQGYCPEALSSLTYDLSNATGLCTNQQAFVLDQYYSTNTWENTTNTFQAFDLPLTHGANVLTFHATDLAGNITTTNFTYTLSYANRTNPPVVQLYWPQNGTQISGGNFTIRGCLDDFTTALQATIVTSNGVTNTTSAIVERNGNFWIENLPLAAGANEVTLTATDVASNVTTTNITVTGSSLVLTMNPIESSQLWQVSEYVSGTISATNYAVWVNGVEATNYGNGTWDATVPTTAGGTAVCQVRAIPYSDNGGAGSGGSGGSGSGSGGSGGGGAPGYGAMCNPCSAYAMDVEVVQDRPERLYVSQYSVNQSGGNSQGEFGMTAYTFNYAWNITWNDGAGGNGNLSDAIWNWTEWSGDTSESFSQTATWPATYWPDLEYGTCAPAGTWPTVLFGNGTNAYAPGIILDYCDVNCPTNKTDGTNYYNTTYIDQEQANMKFFCGGKSVPGQQNLYWITCPVVDQLSTNPILPQDVSLGSLGQLNANSNLFVAVPSGANPSVTPRVAGRQWYTFNPSVTPLPVTLTANGYNLAQTNPTFCVGQQITFNLSCPGLPMTNVFCAWKLTGNYVNSSIPNSAGCEINTTNLSLLNGWSNTCQCWYYNGASGTVNVQANVMINGTILHTTATGTFNIYTPQLTNYTSNPPFWLILTYVGLLSGEELEMAPIAPMGYVVDIASSCGGTAGITQVFDDDSSPKAYGSNVLDTSEFYPYPGPPTNSVEPNVPRRIPFSDNPSETSGIYNSVSLNVQFRDYVRFQPSQPNSIFVTLGKVTWNINGSATNGANGWVPTTGTNVAAPDFQATSEWPYWTNTYSK